MNDGTLESKASPSDKNQSEKSGRKYENPKVRRTIFGTKYWVPIIEKMGDPLKETQPELFTVIKKLFERYKGAFIDVGVNCGQTLTKVYSADPEIPYFGFEVNINACFFVDQFLKMNRGIENYSVFPVALSNKVSILKLYRKGLVGAGASIVEKHKETHVDYKHKEPILAVNGDQVIPSLGISELAVIKIDVEGGELEVVQGIQSTIGHYRPFIICEVQPINDTRTNQKDETADFRNSRRKILEELFRSNNYLFHIIEPDGDIRRVSEASSSETVTRDYLFVPAEAYEEDPAFFDKWQGKNEEEKDQP